MNKKYTNILPTVNEALEGVTNLFASEETTEVAAETTETTNTMKEVFGIIGKEVEMNLSLYQWYRYAKTFHDVKFKQVTYDPKDWIVFNKSTENSNGERIETYINKKARHNDDKHITIVKLVDHELAFAVEGANINVVTNALFQELPYPLTTHVDVYRNLFNNFITFKNRTTGESYTTMMKLDDIVIEKVSDDLTSVFPNLSIDEGEYEDILKLAAYVDYFYSTYENIKTINESIRKAFEEVSTIYNYEKLHEILQSIYTLTDTLIDTEEKTVVTLLEEMRFYLDDLPFDEEIVKFADALFDVIEETLYFKKKEIADEYSGCYIEIDGITGEILNTPLMLRSDRTDLTTIKEFEVCHACKGVYYYNRKLGMYIQENDDCSYCKN